ncbi:MAG: hypothetical protein WCV91_05635 [Candidatus Margulisiibacteriota bacterium]
MGLVDIAKKILSKFPGIKISVLENLHLEINTTINQPGAITNNMLKINPTKLSEEDREEIRGFIRSELENGATLLETSSEEMIGQIKKEESTEETERLLNFLRDKIPSQDLSVWRASLYLRSLYRANKKENVQEIKDQIIERYGDRGRNIANLCSANYLEDFFIPLYDSYSGEAKKEAFVETYDDIVTNHPFSIFVNAQMTKSGLEEEIVSRKKYGIKLLNIHGIGKSNIKIINEVITKIEDELESVSMKKEVNSISVKILFK